MSFSFRNMFSKDDENAAPDAEASNSNGQPPEQPFMNPQQTTGDGNFQAMFDQTSGAANQHMPMMGGAGVDPRGGAPLGQQPAAAQGVQQHYLASELLAFIPPALAAQGGIPMEQTVAITLPANGSTEVRLSAICAACPQLFAVEITPLNDSVVTLPPRLAAPPQQQQQAPPQAGGMDLASMRANAGGPPAAKNPFADAVNSPIHPQSAEAPSEVPTQIHEQAPSPAASPFGAPTAEKKGAPSPFNFPPQQAGATEAASSGFSPFGAPPQTSAAAPQAEPTEHSGATPTVGFSAIGPIPDSNESGQGSGSVFGPTTAQSSIFPGGNPFDEPSASTPAPGAEAPANPFAGGDSPFGGPASASAEFAAPSSNPFESSESFSTVFSEKAQEDEQLEAPSAFGAPAEFAQPQQAAPTRDPEPDLPTVEDALPPQPTDTPNPFAQFEPSPASSQKNPFGELESAPQVEDETFEDALPPQPIESSTPPPASPFGESATAQAEPTAGFSEREAAAPQEPAPAPASVPQPSTGFEPPRLNPSGDLSQRSPFHPIDAPAQPTPAAREPEPTPAPEKPSADFESEESDSFDDLSPFTAAVTGRNSFFDEISESTPEQAPTPRHEVQEEAPEPAPAAPPQASHAPAPPVATEQMAPTPRDSVVKNIELRAVFGTNEEFTPDSVATKIVTLEGIATCAIQVGDATSQAAREGQPTMAISQIQSLSDSAQQIAALTGVADASAFTMHTDRGLISIFSHESATIFVRHLSGEFDPGIREKLMLITRGVACL